MKRYVKSAKSQKDIDRLHRWGFTDEEINEFSDVEARAFIGE